MPNNKLSDLAFDKLLEAVRSHLLTKLRIIEDKDVNYGHYMNFTDGKKKASLTVYNGKKGWKEVYAGDDALKAILYTLVHEAILSEGSTPATMIKARQMEIEPSLAFSSNSQTMTYGDTKLKWAGSDESGKGDFFGPLVVAATVVDGTTASKLAAAGVKDCKDLSDKKVLELETVIKQNVIAFSVLILKPRFYNQRYAQISADGGKLNQLLSSGHLNALSKVLEEHRDCKRALIDQFMPSNALVHVLAQKFPNCKIEQRHRAEEDLAVAAASVLARAAFLRTLQELAIMAGVQELPKGGGPHVTAFARELATKLGGKEALYDYAKIHFANYQKI